jgi:alkylhydroperoxidase/carboxymuconolactone decarboxylase family protein YurZ
MQLMSAERVTGLDPVFGPMGIEAGKAIWSEESLSMREKAILLMTADLCVPELGLPFELHVSMALGQAGMSAEELRELLRHIAPDAGFNIVAMGFERLTEVAARLGKNSRSTSGRAKAGSRIYDEATLSALAKLDAKFARDVDRISRELWSRPGLSMRERSLATFAVDVVGGTLGAPFAAHVRLCRAAGLAIDELHAALRALAEFSIPKAWEALAALHALPPAMPEINQKGAAMNEKSADHVTTRSKVEVAKYLREVLDQAGDSPMTVVETRLEEHFTGGLTGTGIATHLRIERNDGTGMLTCFERITGSLDGRQGSFLLQASGYTDRHHHVHGRWEVIEGSGTADLSGLRGYAAFAAAPDRQSKTGWSADTALTYWFEQ